MVMDIIGNNVTPKIFWIVCSKKKIFGRLPELHVFWLYSFAHLAYQESPESPGPRSQQEPSTGRAETQGAENSRQDNQIVIDLEDMDAVSITTLSDIDPEELD